MSNPSPSFSTTHLGWLESHARPHSVKHAVGGITIGDSTTKHPPNNSLKDLFCIYP